MVGFYFIMIEQEIPLKLVFMLELLQLLQIGYEGGQGPTFLLSVFLCSQSSNHLQEDLANFGYKQDMKVSKFNPPWIFLDYLLEPCIQAW